MGNGFTEAPASWNCRYITPAGYSCQLTLRGENGQDLLPKTELALTWLAKSGCTPNGQKPAASGQAQGGEGWCSVHQVAMSRREKDGQSWWSHKADGSWCRGGK